MLPTPSELQKAWEDIQRLHTQYLAVHEVIIPKVDDYAAHNRSLQLAVLWHYRDREVHKDEVSAIAQRDRPGAATDQQIRHLKRDGWDIGPKPGRHKLNPFRPSQEFVNEAVASVRPVSRASSAVQREIRNLLCESEERESHASSDLQDGQP